MRHKKTGVPCGIVRRVYPDNWVAEECYNKIGELHGLQMFYNKNGLSHVWLYKRGASDTVGVFFDDDIVETNRMDR